MDVQNLIPTSEYPCSWDDLIDPETKETIVSIASMSVVGEEEPDAKLGIIRDEEDGIWDIYIQDTEITEKRLESLLRELTKKSGVKYKLNWDEEYINFNRVV